MCSGTDLKICNQIDEVPSRKTNKIKEKLICAAYMRRQSYYKYQNVVRAQNGKCSRQMKVCPGKQSPDHQLCVIDELTDCPINSLRMEKID